MGAEDDNETDFGVIAAGGDVDVGAGVVEGGSVVGAFLSRVGKYPPPPPPPGVGRATTRIGSGEVTANCG